jgi:histone-lysine N-methyltransferase SETMAR
LHIDFLHDQKTVNAAYYCDLLEKVRAAYRPKRRSFPIRDVLLLHNNARPHTAALTQKKLAELYWTALEHRPYSPDLSPCDFFLFGPLKEALGGERFNSNQQVEQFMCNWLKHDHLHSTTLA